MKKITLILAVLLVNITTLMAQDSKEKNTIQVNGFSEIAIIPDEAIINISAIKKAMTASEATKMLNQQVEDIQKQINKSKLKDYKLTTDNYQVNINRIYTKGTSKDSGYVARQNVKIKISNPEVDLVKAVQVLGENEEITFNVQFGISEEKTKSYKETLLQSAIKDARYKAELIASTMDLGPIKVSNITYSSGGSFDFPRPQMEYRMMKAEAADAAPSFNPEEQKLTDNIMVVFSYDQD
ncbi:SIMPL domain-containing protein [Echinicola pacifica]|nr:SIMPL domain-containing protein [Echinicola pacifica]